MKTIIKYLSAFALVFFLISCDEENNFDEPNIALTPVYTVSDIQGANTPFKINIYREKSLIIEYSSSVNTSSFESSNYSDTSTESNYTISVDKTTDLGTETYAITADKITGDGTLTVDGSTVFNVTVSEEEVYN